MKPGDLFSWLVLLLAAGCSNCTRGAAPQATGGLRQETHSRRATRHRPPAPAPKIHEVDLHLKRVVSGAATISFGLPLPRGSVTDAAVLRVLVGGQPIRAAVQATLLEHDENGDPVGVRAVLIQLPASTMRGPTLDVRVDWRGTAPVRAGASAPAMVPYRALSFESSEVVQTAERTIVKQGAAYALVETSRAQRVLFSGREPRVLATYPDGYLAQTGILGPQMTRGEVQAQRDLAGVRYLSQALPYFAWSAMYVEPYPLNPDRESVVDPVKNFEGWLYDRCATFLTAYIHTHESGFLRHAYRTCSYYSAKITPTGIFSGKSDPDLKYSHLRGLYAYYALTGDGDALRAGRAIAEMWRDDTLFVAPYRQGHLRGVDKLWTERLLAASLEGLYYGHRLTGDKSYLTAFEELLDTAYRHITTSDQATLDAITLGHHVPQNCFVHSVVQHSEGDDPRLPWCSSWMSELLIEPLLSYQQQTGDPRVDEIFVRLARFLRDVGSSYFEADPLDDYFLRPATCYDPERGEDVRRLIPLYGAGLMPDGRRFKEHEADFEHCADATALTAAALRALKRQGKLDQGGPVGPFATEGQSFLYLHHELSFCAKQTFLSSTRRHRDPATWSSQELAEGASNPQKFIKQNRIGFPRHTANSPQRKLSWLFNTSMLQFRLLRDAGIKIPALAPGQVQPAGKPCR